MSTHFLWLPKADLLRSDSTLLRQIVLNGALQLASVQRARVVEFLLSAVGLSQVENKASL